VGYAWQNGLLPLSRTAIFEAIKLNGVKVDWNQQAFEWGRRTAHDPASVLKLVDRGVSTVETISTSNVDELVAHRSGELVKYQNTRYAERYRQLIDKVRQVEAEMATDVSDLTENVARYAHKLMAYKDEYEVARLHSDPEFKRKLSEQFEGDYKLQFNLSPPLLARNDKNTGLPGKMTFGPWMMGVFGLLAKFRFLRGTWADPFGWTAERKLERQLIEDYFLLVEELMGSLDSANYDLAVELAGLPEQIRGFGHVKLGNIEKVSKLQSELLERFRQTRELAGAA
jgi:indolepyruvate ferredoxin oxidoreductase